MQDRPFFIPVLAIAAAFVGRLVVVSIDQLGVAFDLAAETIGAATIQTIHEGKSPYDPHVYAQFPFRLNVYTPLYYYLVAALPAHPTNPFFTARVVSGVAMLASAATLFFVVEAKQQRWLAIVPVAVFCSFWPVVSNAALTRHDPMALLFAAAAVVLADRSRDRPWAPVACALLAVLALAVKQSYVASGVALAVWFAGLGRRPLAGFVVTGALAGGLFSALATAFWGRDFWFCTVSAMNQPMTVRQAGDVMLPMFSQPVFVALLASTALASWVALRRGARAALHESPYLLYLIASTAVLLGTFWKTGAGTNYTFEWLLAQLFWLTFLLRTRAVSLDRPAARSVAVAFAACCVLELGLADRTSYSFVNEGSKRQRSERYERMRAELRALGLERPWILSPFSHGMSYPLTSNVTFTDPYTYRLLWTEAILDPGAMVGSIMQQRYDLILMPNRIGPVTPVPAPFDAIVRASFLRYQPAPGRGPVGGFQFLLRRAVPAPEIGSNHRGPDRGLAREGRRPAPAEGRNRGCEGGAKLPQRGHLRANTERSVCSMSYLGAKPSSRRARLSSTMHT